MKIIIFIELRQRDVVENIPWHGGLWDVLLRTLVTAPPKVGIRIENRLGRASSSRYSTSEYL